MYMSIRESSGGRLYKLLFVNHLATRIVLVVDLVFLPDCITKYINMSYYKIVFLLLSVITTFVKVTVGYELEDYKLYAIQNADDNTVYKISCKLNICNASSSLVF